MAITPSDETRADGSDEGHIMAGMYTKSQTGYLDEYGGLDSSGNCCVKAQQREALYGINAETYEQLFLSQHRRCAICGTPPTDQALSVDHNHRIGQLRGLLCGSCNFGLIRALDDDPSLLDQVIAYRKQHPVSVVPSQGTDEARTP